MSLLQWQQIPLTPTIMANLKIVTYNAKGLDDYSKRQNVFVWLKSKKADIILLQETHSNKNKEKVWKKDWEGDIIFSHGASNARGVCVCFTKSLNYELIQKGKDKWGRILILDIKIDDIRLTIGNIYAPNDDNPEFFDQAFNLLNTFKNEYIIMGGDFNLVFDVSKDKKGGRPTTHEKCKTNLIGWMEEYDLVDIWRKNNPKIFNYTWKSYKKPFVYCRLDFFLISFSLCSISKKNIISPGFRSDHNIVNTSIMFEPEPRGPGFWKMNCSLMDNVDYDNAIIECIENCELENPGTGHNLLWDTIKCRIRGTSIKISSKIKRESIKHKTGLENSLKTLKDSLPDLQSAEDIETCTWEITNIEKELENIIKKEADGIRIRSKTQYYEEGEKSTRYFHNLEKRNQENKNIKLLENDKGETIKGVKNILNEEVQFYKNLYSSRLKDSSEAEKQNSYKEFLVNSEPENLINISDINIEIKEDDIKDIIDTFACNKSPGSDGLPIEFYRKYWIHIKKYLLNSYTEIWETGQLSITQKQGVITLIPKKGKNPKKLQNWRPITLLNTDYKILTKYLAYYIKNYLTEIINYNQKGFLAGRFIGENINNAFSLIEYCRTNNIAGLLLFLDYNKAFDCVEWNMIEKTLKFFGFKENIVKWINAIYNCSESYLINNGHISEKFKLYRGLRQGCPLSPYLFILIVELLAIHIRRNIKIKGIRVGNIISKVHQYADDTFLSILNDNESILEIFRTIDNFSIISGLTLNKHKTEILYIGDKVHNVHIKREWVKREVTLLGIKISDDQFKVQANNYAPKLQKIEDCLKIWQQRNLSLIGRIHIIKSLAGSQLVYNWSTIINPTEQYFKDVETVLYKFLWNSPIDRVKRKYMIAKYEEGGLQMLDIRSQCYALKLKWIGMLSSIDIEENMDVWKEWVYLNTPNVSIKYLLCCNLSNKDLHQVVKFDKNSFWYEVFTEWCNLNHDPEPYTAADVYGQSIWFNSKIKKGNKVIFHSNWYNHGIRYLRDLLDGDRFYTATELSDKYGLKINFLDLMGIISTIQKEWKNYFTTEPIKECDYKIETTCFTCKMLYKEIIERRVEIPDSNIRQWEATLNIEIDDWDWLESFSDCFKWTTSTKLRSFMFQLRNLDIMCNLKLYHMRKRTDPFCEWCNAGQQTIAHLFWDCPVAQTIWSDLTAWINKKLNCQLKIEKELVFLYDIEAGNLTCIINLLVLVTCRYIYVSKCINIKPNSIGAIHKITETEGIERTIACKKGKLVHHIKKWSTIVAL